MSFCIFCGAPPSEKTREHIMPQWLLKLTGDPNRPAFLGRDWLSPDLKKRIYSWNAFTFPACDACNTRWSQIEGDVKSIVERMLASQPLAAQEFYRFLDWIDKVRTGLWLGMIYLNKNYRGLIPQFHIDERVAQKDRALLIYEADDALEGVGMSGVDTPVFHMAPSVCVITINQFYFVSMSSDFFLAKRLGWPYASARKMKDIDTDGFSADMETGTQKITSPVLTSLPSSSGAALFQPIAHQYLRRTSPEAFNETFLNPYIKESSIDEESGIGRLLIGNDQPTVYPLESTDEWRPPTRYERDELAHDLGLWTANLQRALFADQPDYSHFPDADREARTREIEGVLKIQDLVIKHLQAVAQLVIDGWLVVRPQPKTPGDPYPRKLAERIRDLARNDLCQVCGEAWFLHRCYLGSEVGRSTSLIRAPATSLFFVVLTTGPMKCSARCAQFAQ